MLGVRRERSETGAERSGGPQNRAAWRCGLRGPGAGTFGETRQVLDLAWGLLAGGHSGGLGGTLSRMLGFSGGCWGSAGVVWCQQGVQGSAGTGGDVAGLTPEEGTLGWGRGIRAGSSELAEGGRTFGRGSSAGWLSSSAACRSSPGDPSAGAGGRGSGRGDFGGWSPGGGRLLLQLPVGGGSALRAAAGAARGRQPGGPGGRPSPPFKGPAGRTASGLPCPRAAGSASGRGAARSPAHGVRSPAGLGRVRDLSAQCGKPSRREWGGKQGIPGRVPGVL